MTTSSQLLPRTLMTLCAMLFLVVATPAMSQKACPTGTADCDGNKQNKCETNIQNNVNNCGSCGKVCSFPNTTSACVNGSCQVSACSAGYGNCDGTPSNGCEIHIGSDPGNCGACGKVCSLPNASCSCKNGSCTVAACAPRYNNCDGNPNNGCEVDIANDPRNCEYCGHLCQLANAVTGCRMGTCYIETCNSGFVDSDGNPVNGCETRL